VSQSHLSGPHLHSETVTAKVVTCHGFKTQGLSFPCERICSEYTVMSTYKESGYYVPPVIT